MCREGLRAADTMQQDAPGSWGNCSRTVRHITVCKLPEAPADYSSAYSSHTCIASHVTKKHHIAELEHSNFIHS